jgi:hypothetical protein
MKYQFIITIIILSITTTIIVTSLLLLSIPFSFALSSNNVAKASSTSLNTSSSSSPFLSGIISSLILDIPVSSNQTNNNNNPWSPFNITNIQKFILAGDWNIKLHKIDNRTTSNSNISTGNLQVTDFTADFIAISKDGKGAHTHQISNFNPITITTTAAVRSTTNTTESSTNNIFDSSSPPSTSLNVFTPDGNSSILGTVDVGINGQKIWDNVRTNITISEGKTIKILLDDRDVDYHFGKGQAIYGLVTRSNLG